MEIFACICLIVIMMTIQHLLNWMWRKFPTDVAPLSIIISILGGLISCVLLFFIIKWGFFILFKTSI
jgi:hypothetical protein